MSDNFEDLSMEIDYEEEGVDVDDEPIKRLQHESIINPNDLINITKMRSSELEERLMRVIMSLETLLGRCQLRTKFTTFLSSLVEEYKEEQKLGKGKGITTLDTLNSLRYLKTSCLYYSTDRQTQVLYHI